MRMINIFTGNHKKIEGIKDHIDIIKEIEPFGFEVVCSDDIVLGAINVIIEEFTSKSFARELRALKSAHPSLVLILVMTEVPDLDLNGSVTLNPHISPFANNRFLLNFEILPFRLRRIFDYSRSFRLVFLRPLLQVCRLGLRVVFKIGDGLSFLGGALFKKIWRRFFSRSVLMVDPRPLRTSRTYERIFFDIYYASYMRERAIALSEVLEIFDDFWDFHPLISKKMFEIFKVRSQTLYPALELGPKRPPEDRGINYLCTGQKTSYRVSVVQKLQRNNRRANFILTGFKSDKDLLALGSFSLNIPQTAAWPLSSPVRFYRSLRAGIIPVLYTFFDDHPIEKCGVALNEIESADARLAYDDSYARIIQRISVYNNFAASQWKSISERVLNINLVKDLPSLADGVFVVLWSYPLMPPVLIKREAGYNIVYFLRYYWAVPSCCGPVDLRDDEVRRALKFKSESLSGLENKIKQ